MIKGKCCQCSTVLNATLKFTFEYSVNANEAANWEVEQQPNVKYRLLLNHVKNCKIPKCSFRQTERDLNVSTAKKKNLATENCVVTDAILRLKERESDGALEPQPSCLRRLSCLLEKFSPSVLMELNVRKPVLLGGLSTYLSNGSEIPSFQRESGNC